MFKIAKVISAIFSPLLVPTYGVWIALNVSAYSVLPSSVLLGVTAVVFMLTGLFPFVTIFALHRIGKIDSMSLNDRNDRTLPYAITAFAYLLCAFYLRQVNAQSWIIMFMVGGLCALLISMTVNLRWKISGHLAAQGGLFGVIMRVTVNNLAYGEMLWLIVAVIIVAGMVGSSRLLLQRHTLWQTIAGFVNGFLSVFMLSAIEW